MLTALAKPVARLPFFVALLIAEIIALTRHYDIHEPLHAATFGNVNFLTWLFDFSTEYWRATLWIMGSCLIFLTPHQKTLVSQLSSLSTGYRWHRWLLLHLLCFGLFAVVTALIFKKPINPSHLTIPWFLSWLLLAGGTLLLWLLSLAPVGFWSQLARKQRKSLLIGVLAGLCAWILISMFSRFEAPLGQETLWVFLSGVTFQTVYALLSWIYADLTLQPEARIVGTAAFPVEVTHFCSGIEGILLIVIFLTIYLCLFRKDLRFPQAFWLFPVGIAIIWVANAVRIVLLIIVGTSLSPEIAQRGFHTQAGWIAFILIAFGLITLSHKMRFFSAQQPKRAVATQGSVLAIALLAPLLVQLAALMVTSAFSTGFDWLYPLRIMLVAAVLFHYRKTYLALVKTGDWWAVAAGVSVFILWLLLEKADDGSGAALKQSIENLPDAWSTAWLCFRVIGSSIVIPIAEELAFRGYLSRKLIANDFENVPMGRFSWLSFVVSSILFGLLHDRWLAGTLAGMAYAAILYRRKQLGDAILAHMTTNALIAVAVLTQGKWALWT